MRIALVVERFEPTGGGVENLVWNVARELVRAGDDVSVLARRAESVPGITLHRVTVPHFWQPLRVSAFARRIRERLGELDVDVVHSFCRTLSQDVFHAGGGCHADYMHSTYGVAGSRWRKRSPRHAVQLDLEGKIFGNKNTITECVSTKVQREIASRYGVPESRLPVIQCGVDNAKFAPERNARHRDPMRTQLRAGTDTVWLFAGSGWRRKGLDIALESLARTTGSEHQLWIAGRDAPGPWRRRAHNLAVADRVRFLGERNDLDKIYAAADALLLPTRYDGFGLVCLEAAAAGRPVVVSDRAGAAELFGDCGKVIEGGDVPDAYAAAMDELGDRHLRDELGAKALEMARGHNWSRYVQRLRELYSTIVASRSSP
jgi:UDP-glucose:(heptosyl)LPS alpha-1,3-glucosyltransferase